MTPRQIALARHALGLRPTRLISHRNHYHADVGSQDHADWSDMAANGYATSRGAYGFTIFSLTRAGADAALLPGDKLDPEVWK